MSNTPFYVPKLKDKGVWLDWRGKFAGGYGWRHNIALSGIKKIGLHHSVTNPTKNATKDVQTIYNIHVGGNGWSGIGYNFIITSEEKGGFAKVAYVGDLANARAHTPNTKGAFGIRAGYGNNHIIGICFIGSFHTGKLPTKAQLRSAHYLVQELIYRENARLPKIADTWGSQCGHKECDPTACPSNQLAKLKKLVETTKEEVKVKLPYTKVKINKKQVKLVRDATVWDLNFKAWAQAKGVGTVKKGTVIDVTEAADHVLGSRYYLYGKGGINKADVKDYSPPPPPPPVTAPKDPIEQVTEPPVERDPDGLTKDDLKGVHDSMARMEALLNIIWEALKSLLSIFNLKKGE